jgi:hypothetical protein
MLLASYNRNFIVQATVITIANYDRTVITIVNYDCKTFIVQATDYGGKKLYSTGPSAACLCLKIILVK